MHLAIVTSPAFEVVSLDLAKQNLGIFHALQDELVATKLQGAIAYVQEHCSIQLAEAEFVLTADTLTPNGLPLRLLPYPLISISKFEIIRAGATDYEEVAAADYRVDFYGNIPRLSLRNSVTLSGSEACVKVTFKAGFSSVAAIPAQLINAVLMVCHHTYENPGVILVGKSASALPNMDMFLKDWRVSNV